MKGKTIELSGKKKNKEILKETFKQKVRANGSQNWDTLIRSFFSFFEIRSFVAKFFVNRILF